MVEGPLEKKIRDYSINHLREKLLNMKEVEKASESFLHLLSTLLSEEPKASFEIRALKGEMEAFSIKKSKQFAVDLLKLNKATKTECTATERSILFKPSKGSCVLTYTSGTLKECKFLNQSESHEIHANTQFTLETNGAGCDLILLLGGIDV